MIDLGRKKRLIAVLDGDRGGDLIEKELEQVARVERVFAAPHGKEVEDLTPVEVLQLLRGEAPQRATRSERAERAERPERPERTERMERVERMERQERMEGTHPEGNTASRDNEPRSPSP